MEKRAAIMKSLYNPDGTILSHPDIKTIDMDGKTFKVVKTTMDDGSVVSEIYNPLFHIVGTKKTYSHELKWINANAVIEKYDKALQEDSFEDFIMGE